MGISIYRVIAFVLGVYCIVLPTYQVSQLFGCLLVILTFASIFAERFSDKRAFEQQMLQGLAALSKTVYEHKAQVDALRTTMLARVQTIESENGGLF
jgi:hypothetical protein